MRDYEGNHLEVFGYEGWPDLQDYNLADELPDFHEHEEENAE